MYSYKVMSFGLKNVRDTYQRMITSIFKPLLGKSMEAYVDDMVIKSKRAHSHVKYLKEVFSYLNKINMKLNLDKCTFGVKAGKFLGYLITHRGIELNPDKVRAIIEMRSPSRLKELQRLTGRLTALSRFLPKSGDKCHQFFSLIRNRDRSFKWNEQCEEAFQNIK